MEFTRLADVEVVETANDTDKVLIEQNGEIKRVPKTEVGGGGSGNALILDIIPDYETETVNVVANMTLEETIAAISNRELSGVVPYILSELNTYIIDVCVVSDYSAMLGREVVVFEFMMMGMTLFWTADGFSPTPPEELG